MKFNSSKIKSIYVFLLLLPSIASAQTDDNLKEIDPRKYITLYYQQKSTQGQFDTIWNWETDKRIPFQKFNLLDINGEIKIDFNKLSLIKNTDFEGTITLEAEISGENGTRKIEVNPYSEVGVQRQAIGIKSDAPSIIANKLLNMFILLQEVDYGKISSLSNYTKDDLDQKVLVDIQYKAFLNIKSDDSNKVQLIEEAETLFNLFNNYFGKHAIDKLRKEMKFQDMSITEIKKNISIIYSDYNYSNAILKKEFVETYKKSYNFIYLKLGTTLDYLQSFEQDGDDAKRAFLSLINKDLVGYSALKKTLLEAQQNLLEIKPSDNSSDETSILLKNSEFIRGAYQALYELSQFRGTRFEQILREEIIRNENKDASKEEIKKKLASTEYLDKSKYYDYIMEHLQDLSQIISLEAGNIIYKKLVYATIDLGRVGAKPNEVLNIYVTWILDPKNEKIQPRLPIGRYTLNETGWKVEIADMFALIKRNHESRADQDDVSPSNFKGSGGVVLMWTYYRKDIGLNITKEKNENKQNATVTSTKLKIQPKQKFINFLEPSIGINVSYLDFSTKKDVEIGTGLQLGLFRNKIFFGYGVNLHMLSPNQAPTYFYLGFSFAKVSDLFKNSPKISPN